MIRIILLCTTILLLSLGASCNRDAVAGDRLPNGRSGSHTASLDSGATVLEQRIQEAIDSASSESATSWLKPALRKFYESNGFQPAWSTTSGWVPLVSRFLMALRDIETRRIKRDYLPAGARALLMRPRFASDVAERIPIDVKLSTAFMRYARDFATHCVTRKGRNIGKLEPDQYAPDRLLADALGTGDARFLFLDRFPSSRAYARLVDALVRYEHLHETFDSPKIPPGETLRVGDRDRRVSVLRERLWLTGDLKEFADGDAPDLYDEAIEKAVRHFQARHGLKVDGIVGPDTLEALNVPIEHKIRQIQLNLRRWGCLPESLGDSFILVNIPEFRLRAYEDGVVEVLRMQVIVGATYEKRETPVFHDSLEYLVFGPYWNVPHSIATGEIIPKARSNENHFAKKGYEIVSGFGDDAEVHEADETALARVAAGELHIRQIPGPNNALGRVKFIFPNDFNVYLHDTPRDELFGRARRAFSHGCIRVERPADLAFHVLAGTQKHDGTPWTWGDIVRLMEESRNQRVYLENPLSVYIVYLTAWAEEDGTVIFGDDVYGYDATMSLPVPFRE